MRMQFSRIEITIEKSFPCPMLSKSLILPDLALLCTSYYTLRTLCMQNGLNFKGLGSRLLAYFQFPLSSFSLYKGMLICFNMSIKPTTDIVID